MIIIRHFIPHFQQDIINNRGWDDNHKETTDYLVLSQVQTTPDPELVTCPRCQDYMRSQGITKSIAEGREPIDMDAVPVSPFKGYLG